MSPSRRVKSSAAHWPERRGATRVLDLYPSVTSRLDPRSSSSSTFGGKRQRVMVRPSANMSALPDMSLYVDYLKPHYDQAGEMTLEVECGKNRGLLYLTRLCQGSKGPCILHDDMWLTPNEFQFVSGRETAKDWKRSIRHHGKSMKLLLAKGILAVHPPICDCDGCRISSPVNRGRLAEKRMSLPEEYLMSNGVHRPEVTSQGPLTTLDIPTDPPVVNQIMDSSKIKVEQTCTHNSQETEKKLNSRRLNSIIDQLIRKTKECNKEANDKSNHENNNEPESSGSDEICEDDLKGIKLSLPTSTDVLSPGSKDRTLNWIKSVSDLGVINNGNGSQPDRSQGSSSKQCIAGLAASAPLPSPPVHPRRCSRKKCARSGRGEEEVKRKKEAKDGSSPSPPPRTAALVASPSAKVHLPSPRRPSPSSMPADTLVVDAAKIKTERLSPSAVDSRSPSASPRSPAARSQAVAVSSRAFSYNSPPPAASTPGLDRFSPASFGSCTGTPILKQMEQMMTRNYSDFMRSLAAKYNNSNPTESYNYPHGNGFMRNFDGRFPLKTPGTPPPSTGSGKDELVNRKNDNHSAPPVLGEQRANMSTPLRVVDLSSTQALINMMRSASAQNASQLENYLRGTLKRPHGLEPETKTHPLDLTVNSSKKMRTDGLPFDPAALSLRLHHGGGKSIRDFHDLFGSFKSDSEGSDVSSDASPKSTNSRLWSSALADPKRSPAPHEATSPGATKTTGSAEPHPCLSTCTDRSCTDESEASAVAKWTVDDVCKFVTSIDTCAEYAETFREQSIDGAALPLLTEEHLINNMNMKLGPALKFRATLAKTIGHCAVCMHCIHCHGSGSASNSGSTERERRVTEST